MIPKPASRETYKFFLIIFVVFFYVIISRFIFFNLISQGLVTPITSATGIVLGIFLTKGPKTWPLAFILAFLINYFSESSFQISIFTSALISLGNIFEGLLGFWIFNKKNETDYPFNKLSEYFSFLFFSLFILPIITSFFGVLASIARSGTQQDFWNNLSSWWMVDSLGIIQMAPLLLAWLSPLKKCTNKKKWEIGLLLFGTFFIGQIIFFNWFHDLFGLIYRGYWMYLCIIFLALRAGPRGITLALVIITIQSLLTTSTGEGFFNSGIIKITLINFWFYSLILSIVGESLTAIFNERSNTEKKLSASALYARNLIESGLDPLFSINTDGKIIDVNNATELMIGISRNELIGRDFSSCFTDSKKASEATSLVWKNGSFRDFTLIVKPISGDSITVLYSGTLLKNQLGKPIEILVTIRDISKQIQDELKLKEAILMAETANRAKSAFLANMSHEIRTPLNSVIGLTDILLETELNQEQFNLVQVAHAAGENLLYLINDILDFSKIESNALLLEKMPFSIREELESCISIINVRAREKNIIISWNMGIDVSDYVLGDPTRFRQIFINLLSNSVKFSEKGEILININPTLDSKNKTLILFSIQDQGIGIPENKIDDIFEKFKQVDPSITRKFGGSGLGLSISKKLIELMGGTIWAKSTLGIGSTFYFTLDLPPANLQEHPRHLNNAKILLCCAQNHYREEIATNLKNNGAFVIEASSELLAIDLLKNPNKEPFNFVLIRCDDFDINACHFLNEVKKHKEIDPLLKMLTFGVKLCPLSEGEQKNQQVFCEQNESSNKDDLIKRLEVLTKIMEKEREVISVPQKPLHILLAEDSKDNRLLIEVYLKGEGYLLTEVENGEEAFNLYKEENFDLIFMDVQMPKMDGHTATREIRNWESITERKHIPIIALSAHAFQDDIEASRLAGCDEHITKPIKKAKLLDVIKRYT